MRRLGKGTQARKKVLVVDAEEMFREALKVSLRLLGYQAELAEDSNRAVDIYQSADESGTPFDAIMLDPIVPNSMQVKETMAKILQIDPKVKAIAFSAQAGKRMTSRFKKFGFSALLIKPFTVNALAKTLEELLTG